MKLVQVRDADHARLVERKVKRTKAEDRTITLNDIIREGLDAIDKLDQLEKAGRRYGA